MTAGNQPSSGGGESAFDICEMIISEEFHLDEENPPLPAIQSYGYAARDRVRAAKRAVCGGGAQRASVTDAINAACDAIAAAQPPRTPLDLSAGELNTLATDAFRGAAQRQPGRPVQDTYLVGGPPDLKAMSGSVESDRVIQLHFRRKATDDDRKWLLEAINEKLATDSAVTPSPGPGEADRLRKGIQDFLDGNHDNPRQHRPEPCRHGQRWYQGCELCDSEHLTKLLTGSSVPSTDRGAGK